MSQIEIPFSRDMYNAAYHGHKVATTRSEAKGEIGDVFHLYRDNNPKNPKEYFVPKFRIIEIMAVDLETVRDLYFRLEGFDSPESFEKTWRALHRGHFTTGKLYFMHIFGRMV